MAFEFDREALSDASQIGFIACRWPVLKNHTLAIFDAVCIARPQSPVGLIGKTMVYLNCDNDAEGAVAFLKKNGVSGSSGALVCRAFLGLCLYLAKRRSESEQVLKEMMETGAAEDADATDLANTLLEELTGK
ncbi:MAG: hypothetical protein F4Y58_04660 [Gammaproteobacteria bacterium]|nr:hypothetical protein [Gammaproteobacteria bacterium]